MKFVRNKQKDHFAMIEKLEKKIESLFIFEERLNKIEKAMENELNETDRRFDTVSNRVDQIGGVIDEHIDSITDLEESKSAISQKLESIKKLFRKLTRRSKRLNIIRTPMRWHFK